MRGLLAAALALATLGLAAGHHEMAFTICDDAPFAPSSVTLDPYPPHPGTEILFQIKGIADHNMQGGEFYAKVTLVVYHHHIPFYTETKDLCDQTTCPIEKGNVTFSYDKTLPPAVPPGKYHLKLRVKDLDENLEMCLELDFHITFPSTDPPQEDAISETDRKIDLEALTRAVRSEADRLKLTVLRPQDKLENEPEPTYVY